MSKHIFEEFPAINPEQWKEQVIKDLKGADFDEKLIWHTNDGFSVKPYYTNQDVVAESPVAFRHLQWQHTVDIMVEDAKQANALATKALNKGATALHFKIKQTIDWSLLFDHILFEYIHCIVELPAEDDALLKSLYLFFDHYQASQPMRHLMIAIAPINDMENSGDISESWKASVFKALIHDRCQLKISTTAYANAGATNVQQLAFALAQLNEYLSDLPSNSHCFQSPLILETTVASNYFFEIAKHRAFRQLTAFLLKQYGLNTPVYLASKTAIINQSATDAYNNMLRTSTEAMSAIIGGCDMLSVGRFDASMDEKNDQAIWWALNQSLILEHESYFNQISDVSAGSYYIETLTHQLCEQAWHLFKSIEMDGGWLRLLKSGDVKRMIDEAYSDLIQQFQSGEKVMVGINKFTKEEEIKANYESAKSVLFSNQAIAQTFQK
jgi:methylmalonyl-CoA mutase